MLTAVQLLQKQGLNLGLISETLAGMQVPLTALWVLLTSALPLPEVVISPSHQANFTGANGAVPIDYDLFSWLNLFEERP